MAQSKSLDLYISDPHGEYEEFSHIIRTACGTIRMAIDDVFGDPLSDEAKDELVTVIAYPDEKIPFEMLKRTAMVDMSDGPKALGTTSPANAWLDEMQYCLEKLAGYYGIANAQDMDIYELARTIQTTAVRQLHVIGDAYDRGTSPDAIMEELSTYPHLDIEWGNHDILWMGAALGQPGCVANAVRICARYNNLDVLEENYGISLKALRDFAAVAYKDDPCAAFVPKNSKEDEAPVRELNSKMQKAISIIQFKVEAQLIAENPSFGLDDRNLLDKIDYENACVEVDGVVYPLRETLFPTVDKADPYRMTEGEQKVIDALVEQFTQCEKLQCHVAVFMDKGSLYREEQGNLLYHACVPLNADGSLKEVELYGKKYKGRALCDIVDEYIRKAYAASEPAERKQGLDMVWYLWLGQGSPLFAKSKMATFELYLIEDKASQKEAKNPYYKLLDDESVMDGVLKDFGIDPAKGRLFSGHVPVKVKDGEDPVKCGGKALIIDGGMSKAYQSSTGVAGFTVVSGAPENLPAQLRAMVEEAVVAAGGAGQREPILLATHQPFVGRSAAVEQNAQIETSWRVVL